MLKLNEGKFMKAQKPEQAADAPQCLGKACFFLWSTAISNSFLLVKLLILLVY